MRPVCIYIYIHHIVDWPELKVLAEKQVWEELSFWRHHPIARKCLSIFDSILDVDKDQP